MISLSVGKRCDNIILISGDFDYAEAIKFVKNNMTKIHLVKIHKGYPPKNRSVSRDLAISANPIEEGALLTTFATFMIASLDTSVRTNPSVIIDHGSG